MKSRSLLALAGLCLFATLHAEWAYQPRIEVPINRILPNLEARAKKDPSDAQAHYLLGRVHSLAYAADKKAIKVVRGTETNKVPTVDEWDWIYSPPGKPAELTPNRIAHLKRTIDEYRIAAKLKPTEGLYFMGLGWALEAATQDAKKVLAQTNEPIAVEAIAAYRTAVDLSFEKDLKSNMWGPQPFYSIEAAEGIIRLLGRFPKLGRRGEVEQMKATIKKVNSQTRAITPILIPLAGEKAVGDLLDASKRTTFDLAGDLQKRSWPWVKPTTGILVWDPQSSGKITSGCQLFGSSTWWMFFADGYQAMATLDADQNGWLEGRELNGIRMWIDNNQNGVSDNGEVAELSALGIRALRTRASGVGDGPFAKDGVRWNDGRITPSFDWCPTSQPAII